ncbi:MAG: glycosyltransferase [Cellulomonadaceae bacterium]|jgi:hypothetical protein|nr:glycosyltransferase [Cellulomonadaceae bacterium]
MTSLTQRATGSVLTAADNSATNNSLHTVHALAGDRSTLVAVTAVVVTRKSSPFCDVTLAAVGAQQRMPDDVIVVDADAVGAKTFGAAVDAVVSTLPDDAWLWLLHDDSAPEPDALTHLLRAIEHTRAVGVVGCKQRRWLTNFDGTPQPLPLGSASNAAQVAPLIEVGHTVSPLGRRMTGIDDTEIDQGQYDGTVDVLAVGLAGALVKVAVWRELGGTDRALGVFGDGTDLCRRALRAGQRVVVEPAAVIHHAQASLYSLRDQRAATAAGRSPLVGAPFQHRAVLLPPDGAPPDSTYGLRRRSELRHRLVHASPLLVGFAWLAMLAWAPLVAVGHLLVKRPARARGEIVAAAWNGAHVGGLFAARRRLAGVASVPRRTVRPLLASWRRVWRERQDIRLARAEAQRALTAPNDVERAELAVLAQRRRLAFAAVMLVAVGAAVAVFGPWLGDIATGGRIVGGGLLPVPVRWGQVWQAATSGWVRDGFAVAAPADPLTFALLAPTALAGGSAQVAVNLLVVSAIPLAALAAWFAAGAWVRSVVVRAVLAVVWGAALLLLGVIGGGHVGALLTMVLAPWVLLAVARMLGVQARDLLADGPGGAVDGVGGSVPGGVDAARAGIGGKKSKKLKKQVKSGSLCAAGAAGLLLAAAVAGTPVLVLFALLAAIVGVIVMPGRRRLCVYALIPTLVFFAPFWMRVADTWQQGGWLMLTAQPGFDVGGEVRPAFRGALEVSAPGLVPAVGRDMQEDGAIILHLDDVALHPSIAYALLYSDGTSLTDTAVAARPFFLAMASAEVGDRQQEARQNLAALIADLTDGQQPSVGDELAALGIGAIQTPDVDSGLAATLDAQPGLIRVTESGTALWRVEAFAASADAEAGTPLAQPPWPYRTPWLVACGIVAGLYLILAVPARRRGH